jgi:hypothetical protein
MNEREQIRLLALDLEVGQSLRAICPFCNATHENSLAITRNEDGLVYVCPRAKCGARGLIPSRTTNYDPHWYKQTQKTKTPKPFYYETIVLPQSLKDMFYEKYNITEQELEENGFLYSPEIDRVVMPVYNYLGYEVGKVARSYRENFTGTKAINYFNDGKSHLHYVPRNMSREGTITCVEDIPSAIRVARFGRAVSILGSYITYEHIVELGGLTKEINLALDPDATHKAFKMRQQYSLYFRNFNVKVLSKDPKDMSDGEIQEEIFS